MTPETTVGLAFGGSETNVDVMKCAAKESAYTEMYVTATVTATHLQPKRGSISKQRWFHRRPQRRRYIFTHAVVDDDDGIFL